MSFVHLHVHTEYSPDAISKIDELFNKAAGNEEVNSVIAPQFPLALPGHLRSWHSPKR